MRGMAQEITSCTISTELIKSKEGTFEPISVLDTRSPSPSTSTSTLGGATTPTPVVGLSDNPTPQQKWPDSVPLEMGLSGLVSNLSGGCRKDDWPELKPMPEEFELQKQGFGLGSVDWEILLSESGSFPPDQSLLRWISGDSNDTLFSLKQLLQADQIDQIAPPTIFDPQNIIPYPLPPPPPSLLFHHQGFNQELEFSLKKQNSNGQSLPVVQPKQEPSRAVAAAPLSNHRHHENQLICDQLHTAAELIISGNFSHAQAILARLNQNRPLASLDPFQRASFYFEEVLQRAFQFSNSNLPSPSNGVQKMEAYKLLTEVSPIIQFVNFTSNQALLEALDDANHIHIIDFDIGFGAQWSSFIQELPRRKNNLGFCSLKITAFASPSTHHPFELGLMHDNLSQFAQELGVSFELEVVNFDSFDPNTFSVSENESIAVNFPVWSSSTQFSAIPSILLFIKQLSPKIIVSLYQGCERTDLPFPDYLLHGLHYYQTLLNSIDASKIPLKAANKIERFIFQPQIESMVMGKLRFPEPTPHWKTIFSAHGYTPIPLSNFAEAQADCVAKRAQVQGFHTERRQADLVLCWQNHMLLGASAWKS